MATETWYEAVSWDNDLRPLEVVAESTRQVTLASGERRVKTSSCVWIRKTKEEAIALLLEHLRVQVAHADEQAADARKRLAAATEKLGVTE